MTGTCAACLHTNQSRSYLNHLVHHDTITVKSASANASFYTSNSKMSDFELCDNLVTKERYGSLKLFIFLNSELISFVFY
jgi:hypothetical protein